MQQRDPKLGWWVLPGAQCMYIHPRRRRIGQDERIYAGFVPKGLPSIGSCRLLGFISLPLCTKFGMARFGVKKSRHEFLNTARKFGTKFPDCVTTSIVKSTFFLPWIFTVQCIPLHPAAYFEISKDVFGGPISNRMHAMFGSKKKTRNDPHPHILAPMCGHKQASVSPFPLPLTSKVCGRLVV